MRLKAVMISVVLLSLAACQLTGGNTPTQSATAISPEPVPSLEVDVSPAAVLTDSLGREVVLDQLPETVNAPAGAVSVPDVMLTLAASTSPAWPVNVPPETVRPP